jgi:hypothetical protein
MRPMEPTDELMTFALFALDHAADSVLDSGGPLIPFALLDVNGERSLARFVGDLEDGQQRARDAVNATPSASMGAVAWDGYVTIHGERTDAVFVEASASGAEASIILAQRYVQAGRVRKRLERLGNAAMVGAGSPLF